MAAAENCPSCSVRRIMEETKFIHKAQSLIEYGNSHVLHSFKVRLVIDEPEEGCLI